MKKLILILLTGFILYFPGITPAADVDEVLESYLAAIGGRDVIGSITSEQFFGEFSVMGMQGETMIYQNKAEKVMVANVESVDGDYRTVLMREYISPGKGFMYGMGEVVEYSEAEVASRMKKLFEENNLQLCLNYKSLGYTAELETEETELGDIHKITFSKDGNKKNILTFDATSSLLIDSEDLETNSKVSYSDYKKVEPVGILKAFSMKQYMSGLAVDIKISEFLINVEEPSGFSEIPEF